MPNDKQPNDKRRVMFRTQPLPDPPPHEPSPSYMILDDDAAQQIADRAVERPRTHDPSTNTNPESATPATEPTAATTSKFRYMTARELAMAADKGIAKAHILGERAVKSAAGIAGPAVDAARRRLPSLATLTGGGKRAPEDDGALGDDGDDPNPSSVNPSIPNDQPPPENDAPDHAARIVHINDESRNNHFPTNYLSTTKYKLWSALPMFLLEQFSRFSNAYFLVVGIGYTINKVSPIFTIGRYSTLWVLAIVVAISGIKEAIEDINRYREDKRLNESPTTVVGNPSRNKWATVYVGDILKIFDREHLPADIVLVASSNDDGLAYIETKQLDGESNLKVKVVPQAISGAFSTESQALLTKGRIECEAPNDRLYKFNGRIILNKVPFIAHARTNDDTQGPSNDITVDVPVPLNPENLLVRGSSVRNTEWVMGIVVNSGRDTKLLQNVKPTPRKNSRLERETNRHYFMCLILQIIIIISLTIQFSAICDEIFVGPNKSSTWWYLGRDQSCPTGDRITKIFTFFIIFSALIPQSLYVSMEIVRAFQVYFIERDQTIYDPVNKIRTEVRTSNLNEELGVVHHVFTDKTGTLTANRMDFKKCSIAGKVYELAEVPNTGATSLNDVKEALQESPVITPMRKFEPEELSDLDTAFRLLAICHTVVAESPDDSDAVSEHSDATTGSSGGRGRRLLRRRRRRSRDNNGDNADLSDLEEAVSSKSRNSSSLNSSSQHLSGSVNDIANNSTELNYQASSPDEAALVQAARVQGYTFLSRSNKDVVIDVFGKQEVHELLETLEFDSTRKRMSVITRGPDGRVNIYTKGADAMIFSRLAPGQSSLVTEQHLHDFAVEGLRTLCLAYAPLDNLWFENWHRRYRAASSQINNREEALAVIAEEVERDLILLGATAIEDKLQDGVPETLRKLEQAGVKIWVLTGDKQETAINIGLSCGAIDEGMDVVIINEDNMEDTAAQLDRALGRWSAMLMEPAMQGKFGLVIDGQTLHFALDEQLQKRLMVVSRMARSVIACRVSPKQKTEIVELVRHHDKDKVTLAIGDGANDVGMIQAAHVGVGIVGLEGQEAKLASDFSISQFRFLARLMLVHGRWNYKRLSKMVLYTIYKNALLTLCELFWATQSAFTGQPLLDPWMGGLFNLFLTSLPPIVLGIFDQELAADYALAFPEIYSKGQRNTAYNFRIFLNWIVAGVWQSAMIFFLVLWGYGDRPGSDGQMHGMWAFGTVVFSCVVVVSHIALLVFQSSWNRLTTILFLISFFSWFIVGPIFSWRQLSLTSNLSPALYAVTHRIFAEPRFWLVMLLCPVICVSPSLLWKYTKRRRRPNVKMLVQQLLRSGKTREDITGEPQKPLKRIPSYDPKRSTAPSVEPVTLVKGEREYQLTGFNFDAGVSGAVLRHTVRTSRVVRRRRMRVLKRSTSDTELHVDGAGGRPHSDAGSRDDFDEVPEDWVRGFSAADADYSELNMEERKAQEQQQHLEPGYQRRPDRSMDDRRNFDDGTGAAPNASEASSSSTHRRTVSDGAVLLIHQLDQEPGYGGEVSSDEEY